MKEIIRKIFVIPLIVFLVLLKYIFKFFEYLFQDKDTTTLSWDFIKNIWITKK